MKRKLLFISVLLTITVAHISPIFAQELETDEYTLLLLHFNGHLIGENGETPNQADGVSYEEGILNQGAYFSKSNQVFFQSTDNINSTEGTLEFWIKPRWSGNDGQGHYLLRFGGEGGMLIGKDGGNFWRSILNRFSANGNPEAGTGAYITNEWQANEWHHNAFTWSNEGVKLYIDGILKAEAPVTFSLPHVNEQVFQIGADDNGAYLDAVIDEYRISSIARSPEEIAASFCSGVPATALAIEAPFTELLETWYVTPAVRATTSLGELTIPPLSASWSSSDLSIASVDEQGRIVGHTAGTATITATFKGLRASLDVTIMAPVKPHTFDQVDPYLVEPAEGYIWGIPVVIIRYLPTVDGTSIDRATTAHPVSETLDQLKQRIDQFNKKIKFMLEEGSRFRGYKNPSARPSNGYRVIEMITVYEPFQFGHEVPWNLGHFFPDYNQVLSRFNAQHYVEDLGVKEFWIWGYHSDTLEQPESNMSSPVTGDISNSSRFQDDLPIFTRTYTVYGYNFSRTQAEAVHNHGHQLEAILSHANRLQDGNTDLFWKQFVGQDANDSWITGRCGWTHMPPNTTEDYDYLNPALVETDCEDWRPDGAGERVSVNVDYWANLDYKWPGGEEDFGQKTESQFYIYWMQNMPGYGNRIPHGTNYMTNWWAFTGDWDGAISSCMGLYAATPTKTEAPIVPIFFWLILD